MTDTTVMSIDPVTDALACLSAPASHDHVRVAAACHVLAELAMSADSEALPPDVSACVLAALRAYHDAVDVQAAACRALAWVAFDESHVGTLVAAGGLTTILQTLRNHPFDADVQTHGCHLALHVASASVTHQRALVSEGWATTIVSAMRVHRADAALQEAACARCDHVWC
jgi:hypothetical protein